MALDESGEDTFVVYSRILQNSKHHTKGFTLQLSLNKCFRVESTHDNSVDDEGAIVFLIQTFVYAFPREDVRTLLDSLNQER
jgi:hypothetical protein